MQYTDYIKQQHDRAERIKQQIKYEPVKSRKQSLWMHTGIDHVEQPKELLYTVIFVIVCAVIIISAMLVQG